MGIVAEPLSARDGKCASCRAYTSLLETPKKRKIRVLSLFDGIATGLFVLRELGLDVEIYYASEIEDQAIRVSSNYFKDKITHVGDVTQLSLSKLQRLGPIDLLIGGSPCNNLSLVNPHRKGLFDLSASGALFFQYYRILRDIQLINEPHDRHLFWLFENVEAMSIECCETISHYLQIQPLRRNSSPEIHPRLFWGNLPWLTDDALSSQFCKKWSEGVLRIADCLTPGNKFAKDRTGMTPYSSHLQGEKGNKNERLGKSWIVPEIKCLLAPFRHAFALGSDDNGVPSKCSLNRPLTSPGHGARQCD